MSDVLLMEGEGGVQVRPGDQAPGGCAQRRRRLARSRPALCREHRGDTGAAQRLRPLVHQCV